MQLHVSQCWGGVERAAAGDDAWSLEQSGAEEGRSRSKSDDQMRAGRWSLRASFLGLIYLPEGV